MDRSATEPAASGRDDRFAGWVLVLIAAGLLVGAAGLVAFRFMPTTAIKRAVDRTTADGNAWTFPISRIELMQTRAPALSPLYAGVGVGLILARRPARRFVGRCFGDGVALVRGGCLGLRRFVREEPWHAAAVGVITGAALWLRWLFIHAPMRCDEASTYTVYSSRALVYAVSDYPAPNNHVLYSALEYFATRLCGGDPWAIRLPALIAGVLLCPATYWVIRRLFERNAALLAAGLVACSSYLIHYSTNGRGYTLVALAFVVLLGLTDIYIRTRNRAALVLIGIVGALGFFAIPTMLYPFGICTMWIGIEWVLEWRRTRSLELLWGVMFAGLLAVFGTIALYTPVLIVSGVGAMASNKYVTPMAWENLARLRERAEEFVTGALASIPWITCAVLGLGLVAAFGASREFKRRPLEVAIPVAVWCVFVLLVQHAAPYGRVWTFLLPLLFGFTATGVEFLCRISGLVGRRLDGAMGLLIVLLCVPIAADIVRSKSPVTSFQGESFADGERIAEYVADRIVPTERILIMYPAAPVLEYYFRRAGLPDSLLSSEPGGPPFTLAVIDGSLEGFNTRLKYANVPTLEATRLQTVERFSASSLYRISPPWTPGP